MNNPPQFPHDNWNIQTQYAGFGSISNPTPNNYTNQQSVMNSHQSSNNNPPMNNGYNQAIQGSTNMMFGTQQAADKISQSQRNTYSQNEVQG